MHWVVQNNLFNETEYGKFVDTLIHMGLPYTIVKPVPFTDILLPGDFDSSSQEISEANDILVPSGPVIAMGTTTLGRIAKKRGWSPGSYLNDNFEYAEWGRGYGVDNILNNLVIVGTVKEFANAIAPPLTDVFVRPTDDSKAIAGTVMTPEEFIRWAVGVIESGETDILNEDTQIMISEVKEIESEYRLFVVDSKVVTGSLYKRGSTVTSDVLIDADILMFVDKMIEKWEPCEAYVLDIARTSSGLKVIEINNINSAGFYASDTQKIIEALEELNS